MSEQHEPVCVNGLPENVATAAWNAIKDRHEKTLQTIKNPGAIEPISSATYTADSRPAAENPKDRAAAASGRIPLDLWPATASAMGSIALFSGSLKYGRANWRTSTVKASVYVAAVHRHLAAWMDGEECDEDGVPHLSAVLASMAIIVDAMASETLVDDRPPAGGYRSMADKLRETVSALRDRAAVDASA